MGAPIQKNACLLIFKNNRQAVLSRYGSLSNALRVFEPYLRGCVPRPHVLGEILDNQPCRQEQADRVEVALNACVFEPYETASRLLQQLSDGEAVTLTFEEALALQQALHYESAGEGVSKKTGSP